MRLAAEELRQEVRGEERDPESQSSAITFKKGGRVSLACNSLSAFLR